MSWIKSFVDRYVTNHAERTSSETNDVLVHLENLNTHLVYAKVISKHTGAAKRITLGTFAKVQITSKGDTADVKVCSIGRTGFEGIFYSDDNIRHVDWFPYKDLLFTFEW